MDTIMLNGNANGGRVRLRQWLEGRLNSGIISGLKWLDASRGIFKIPWKHHSKHTWHENDAAIFKDWAVVTGRYREGVDIVDWPMWKTRLRCALNKAGDIEEVRHYHNLHCDEPYKVYRFISRREMIWRNNRERYVGLIFDCSSSNSQCAISAGGASLSNYKHHPAQHLSENNSSMVYSSSSNSSALLSDIIEPEQHQLCIRILHLYHRVSDIVINNPNGCCIYNGRIDESVARRGSELIQPQLDNLVSDCDRYCVEMLLDNMQRGLVLSTSAGGNIYAEKLCRCATFVYKPTCSASFQLVEKLARRQPTLIFDYNQFVHQLHLYRTGQSNTGPPSVELILAFGQQIKDEYSSTPESLYVWCRLASCKAWFLLQKALSSCNKNLLSNPLASSPSPPSSLVGSVVGGRGSDVTLRNNPQRTIKMISCTTPLVETRSNQIDVDWISDSQNEEMLLGGSITHSSIVTNNNNNNNNSSSGSGAGDSSTLSHSNDHVICAGDHLYQGLAGSDYDCVSQGVSHEISIVDSSSNLSHNSFIY